MRGPVTSRNHKAIKKVKRLGRRAYRDSDGLFLAEGPNLLNEAVSSGSRLTELLFTESRAGEAEYLMSLAGGQAQAFEVSDAVMDWVSDAVTSQGMLGVLERIDNGLDTIVAADVSLLLVADQVRDPGNMGALIRIADAAGADGFILTEGCVDLYNPKVVRSAAGSHFHIPIAKNVPFETLGGELATRGIRMLGLEPRGETDYVRVDYRGPIAILVGNESFGIADEHRGSLAESVYIKMPGRAESLNVASAAAVVVFEALRQRGSD